MWHNPVMFVVEVGAALCTVLCFTEPSVFVIAVTVWLWLTVLFANLADAVAEGRGKAQAASLRATRDTAIARKLDAQGHEWHGRRRRAEGRRPGGLRGRATSSPATGTSSKALPPLTNRRSPANPPRWSGNPAATGPR